MPRLWGGRWWDFASWWLRAARAYVDGGGDLWTFCRVMPWRLDAWRDTDPVEAGLYFAWFDRPLGPQLGPQLDNDASNAAFLGCVALFLTLFLWAVHLVAFATAGG